MNSSLKSSIGLCCDRDKGKRMYSYNSVTTTKCMERSRRTCPLFRSVFKKAISFASPVGPRRVSLNLGSISIVFFKVQRLEMTSLLLTPWSTFNESVQLVTSQRSVSRFPDSSTTSICLATVAGSLDDDDMMDREDYQVLHHRSNTVCLERGTYVPREEGTRMSWSVFTSHTTV